MKEHKRHTKRSKIKCNLFNMTNYAQTEGEFISTVITEISSCILIGEAILIFQSKLMFT